MDARSWVAQAPKLKKDKKLLQLSLEMPNGEGSLGSWGPCKSNE